jgi:hypothetical protein
MVVSEGAGVASGVMNGPWAAILTAMRGRCTANKVQNSIEAAAKQMYYSADAAGDWAVDFMRRAWRPVRKLVRPSRVVNNP